MTRRRLLPAWAAGAWLVALSAGGASDPMPAADPSAPAVPTVAAVVELYEEARGGVESWRRARSLELRGTYASFSDREPFALIRRPDHLYRLDFTILGGPAVRARDARGAWWRHPLLEPEPTRLDDGPYKAQLERESHFAPLLLDAAARGVAVRLIGPGDVDGAEVLELELTLPGGAVESWFLDRDSYLEVAVDSVVNDFTQSEAPMRQRAFYDDFREVGGLVIPFRIDYEFGHRLESMTVEEAHANREIDPARFSPN